MSFHKNGSVATKWFICIIPQTNPFYFDPSTADRISSDPLFKDPYESLFVQLGQSRLPHAGQGLFARTNISPATVIAFYNGIKIIEVMFDSQNQRYFFV